MSLGKRFYWVAALVAVIALAGAAVTLTARLTSAGGSDSAPSAQACDQQDQTDGADATGDAIEAKDAPDTDNVECGPQDAGADTNEAPGAPGKLDDGAGLLSQAAITIDQAIAAAQGAASGDLGEVDLEDYQGKLVFNVDIGGKDVKVDASNAAVLATDISD
jgi:uncharacterized membrane protein YkoI